MNIQQYLDNLKDIQTNLLNLLEHDSNVEENYQNLITKLKDFQISNDIHFLKLVLHMISKISKNHQRLPNFVSKIEKILKYLCDDIKKYFSNSDIFNIFKKSKRILLFLLEEKILIINEYVFNQIISKKYENTNYIKYFAPELNSFIEENPEKFKHPDKISDKQADENRIKTNFCLFQPQKRPVNRQAIIQSFCKHLPDNFYENRKIGENEGEISKLIRLDLIDKFITFVKKKDYPLQSTIQSSIYETNSFLLKKFYIQLIEYAAFFGSTQIFNYLRLNGVKLTSTLWLYSIHGQDEEIIHVLEENKIKPTERFYNYYNIRSKYKEEYIECYNESIKCHHNDIVNYIYDNFIKIKDHSFDEKSVNQSIKSYNFAFIQNEDLDLSSINQFIQYEYFPFVTNIMQNEDFDINKLTTMNEDENYKISCLYMAIEKENIEIIKLLLSNDKIDVNIINLCIINRIQYKKTALYLAVEKENIEIVKLLLSNDKIDINFNQNGNYNIWGTVNQTALYLAIEKENIEIVKLLLSNDKIDVNLLSFAFFNRSLNHNTTPFCLAIEKGNIEIVKLLLSNKKIDVNLCRDPTDKDNLISPLYIAVEKRHIDIVKLLLSIDKVDVNLHSVIVDENHIFNGKKTVFKEIKSSLYLSVDSGYIELTKLLLSCDKIDLNIVNYFILEKYGFTEELTVLFLAVENKNLEMIKLLLSSDGIDINFPYTSKKISTTIEETPLFKAFELGENEIVKLLLENKKIDVNIPYKSNGKGKKILKKTTILHDAVKNEDIELIKLLLKNKKIKKKVKDDKGKEPINYTKNKEIIKLLNS